MSIVVDCDSHFMEPLDLFVQYSSSEYRDQMTRYELDEATGQLYVTMMGDRRRRVNIDEMTLIAGYGEKEKGRTFGEMDSSRLFNHQLEDMDARIQFLDSEGIDCQIIYPSLGLVWQAVISDPDLAAEHCRAYNRWAVEISEGFSDRLFPAGQITLRSPAAMVGELEWLSSQDVRAVFIGALPFEGRSYGDSMYDPIWAACERLDLAVCIHPALNRQFLGNQWYDNKERAFMFFSMNVQQDPRMALTTMMYDGVFDRFPSLRVATVEAMASWVIEWLERFEYRFSYMGHTSGMTKSPREVFGDNVWVSAEADEHGLRYAAEFAGFEKFFFGSDFPHAEGTVAPLKELEEVLSGLPDAAATAIKGGNAAKFFRLGDAVR